MKLDGTFTFNGPRATVWALLQDPEVLAKALPGTERLELVEADRYRGVMKVTVGPVSAAKFDITVSLRDKVAQESFVMGIEGKGAVGHTRGTATVHLSDAGPGATSMAYTSDVQVGGTIAAVGQRLIESVGRSMMKQALDGLDRELRTRLAQGAEPA